MIRRKNLIAEYPELKNLRAGQQFYWILDKEDQLEYLNWLVSEKEDAFMNARKTVSLNAKF